MRALRYDYQDPLDVIWLTTAERLGFHIARDPEVFAAWDGQGGLRIGTPETLDPDDSLAQILLHEFCHALVAGESGQRRPDWGLDYEQPAHAVYEHAALRLQAALAEPFGLRDFLGATTDFREYYDRLPQNPLEFRAGEIDPAIQLASNGHREATRIGWHGPLEQALVATAEIARVIQPFATANSLWTTFSADKRSGSP